MDHTPAAATISAADRRSARRRVGVAAVAAFVALLLLTAARGPARADTVVPATAPATAPTTTLPAAPSQSAPAQPEQQTAPTDPFGDPDHDGFGPRDGGGEEQEDDERRDGRRADATARAPAIRRADRRCCGGVVHASQRACEN